MSSKIDLSTWPIAWASASARYVGDRPATPAATPAAWIMGSNDRADPQGAVAGTCCARGGNLLVVDADEASLLAPAVDAGSRVATERVDIAVLDEVAAK